MKKTIFTALLLASLSGFAQQNSLLSQDFWKTNPGLDAVKAEVAKGNNPAELNPNAFDPVVMAINGNASAETVTYLINQPGNGVKKPTHDGRNYLHWAARTGDVKLVEYLIAQGSDLNLEDTHNYTPAQFAAANGQTNTAIYDAFFKAGIDPKKKYKDGVNLLLIAIPADKDLTLANYFVSKGMSLKDVDASGATAFDYAARTGNIDQLKALIKAGVKYTDQAVVMAAQGSRRSANTIEVYKYLVEDLKLKATATTAEGQTVLHFLARKENQADIIKYFISKGVDAAKADKEGNTPLMLASAGKDVQVLQTLLTGTKDINAVNAKGESALTFAIQNSNAEVAALLIAKGANVQIKDKKGNNLAYHLVEAYRAPRGNQPDDFTAKLTLLKEKGLNLAAPQQDGSTLYHVAVVKNDVALLKKLSAAGIDVNAQNAEGLTALHKAAMVAKDDSVLKYLVSTGAKTNIKTEFDETAYDLAGENELLQKGKVSVDFLK
ncbi:ankyrin [Flavobacterium akiainvivens]|uniref:Ankyrin n=1 Tax=Flavobacterium akiainvivens TaxID=1202724 RepID=A0A0M8MF39_9FLAO|nr:ankyrin repeat domain-containing protein [Flavobacterium akiainvivens]KOS07584.1 ankyrin [Flavobacterium akiainvivens]SFQ22169.1 Ankyrin repeat [Flavobacterium akiainvivens]